MKYHVYGIGNALVDIVAEVGDDFFEKNKVERGLMTLADEARQQQLLQAIGQHKSNLCGGGSAANTVVALAQLGGRAFYSCLTAKDELGKFFLDDLSANGVETNLKWENCLRGDTGRCLVMVSPDAQRTMCTFLGVSSLLSKNLLDENALKNSEWVYAEGYLVASPTGLETIKEAMQLARRHQAKTALTFSDVSMVKYFSSQMKEALGEGVDLLFCNEEECLLFTEKNSLAEALEEMKKQAKQFCITRGNKGALLCEGERLTDIDAFPVQAIDSNGAGDMFAGAFLFGLTAGKTFEEAGRLASLASSRVVTQYGPRLSTHAMHELLSKSNSFLSR